MDTAEFCTRLLYGLVPALVVYGGWLVWFLGLWTWHACLTVRQERKQRHRATTARAH